MIRKDSIQIQVLIHSRCYWLHYPVNAYPFCVLQICNFLETDGISFARRWNMQKGKIALKTNHPNQISKTSSKTFTLNIMDIVSRYLKSIVAWEGICFKHEDQSDFELI